MASIGIDSTSDDEEQQQQPTFTTGGTGYRNIVKVN